jgi:DNA-binding MarR family transcriptional regulator
MELFNKTIGAGILQTLFKFHEIERELSEKAGLTTDEMRCLMTVYLRRPSCVSDLNSMIDIEPTRTSKILNSLENFGLLRREMDSFDRRKSRIEINENGRKISEKILMLSNEFCRTRFNSEPDEILPHLNFFLRNK